MAETKPEIKQAEPLGGKMDVYKFILENERNYQMHGVPITDGYEWSMFKHIKLSTLYKNSQYETGKSDDKPFKNITRPILNVAYRAEGFDVKDINPYVNDAKNYYKTFLVKKFHARWARNNDIDTFLDDLVESYVDFGGALVKDINDVKPEVVPMQRIAFCDQTDLLGGPLCEKHSYSPDQLLDMDGKWKADKIDQAILQARTEKDQKTGQTIQAKTPGKYIQVYELHGVLPESWKDPTDEKLSDDKYKRQIHIVTFYKDNAGKDIGITLFAGFEKEQIYKVILRDKVYGRALGYGGIEELFEPQVWTNYSIIQIKEMLDTASMMLAQTADKSFKGKNKLSDMEKGEVIVHDENKPLTPFQFQPVNIGAFQNSIALWEDQAKTMGSASSYMMGQTTTGRSSFALQRLLQVEGQALHEWRKGKIATFVGEIYRDWVLPYLVKEMNKGDSWLDDLSIEELQYISENISTYSANKEAVRRVLAGDMPTQEEINAFKDQVKSDWQKGGSKKFIEIAKGEIAEIPVDVEISIAGKQKDLQTVVQGLTGIFKDIIAAPQILQNPGMLKIFNEILESSGFSQVDFAGLETPVPQPPQQDQEQPQPGPMPKQVQK